jgi:NAD(P)-dependent dehydrogenase (short-subunit alcohol dehydrogenase family)
MRTKATTPIAVVTGAGSGVGRAVALHLARKGWRVVLIGRRVAPLRETARSGPGGTADFLVCPCDIASATQVRRMADRVTKTFGRVDALVNAAGTNTPRRNLETLTLQAYQAVVDTNLTGAFHCVQAFLPAMRTQGFGTIVNIVSDAARRASAKAGAAYVVSKFGLLGLTQSINAEERANGVRACAVLPGDIDTPLLDKRPKPPSPAARRAMLQAEDVAACAWLAINLPPRAVVEELLIRPR